MHELGADRVGQEVASVVLPVPAGPHRMIEGRCAAGHELRERLAGPDEVRLPDELLERAGTHPGGERLIAHAAVATRRTGGCGSGGRASARAPGPRPAVHSASVVGRAPARRCAPRRRGPTSRSLDGALDRDPAVRVALLVDRDRDARVALDVAVLPAADGGVHQHVGLVSRRSRSASPAATRRGSGSRYTRSWAGRAARDPAR